jgi:nitroimidazol reductase NimA-like FMN-containing flavoprotein (pyridoxamine 5'-phosphate oxidase superfamily)
MLIQELTKRASIEVLGHTDLGRLACARGMQPYVVPIHFAYQNYSLYIVSVSGQKIEWMRANPLVCVEVDQMRREHWATVVVFGRYEELCDTPQFKSERMLAFNLLRQRPMWWDLGGVNIIPEHTPAAVPIFYRIKIEQITGRSAAIEQAAPDTKQAKADLDSQGWLRKIFRRVRKT